MCDKRAYTRREAGYILNNRKRAIGKNGRDKVPRRVYYCKECQAYHLTSWLDHWDEY